MDKIINVLWTGGLDSTYRICELSRQEVTVQPIYVTENRKSEKKELDAIHRIVQKIKRHPLSKFRLLPLKKFDIKELVTNDEISKAWSNLNKKYLLGSQYEYLAALSKTLDSELEIGVTFDPRGKIARTIYGEGVEVNLSKQTNDNPLLYLDLDFKDSSKDVQLIFKNLKMPQSLFHINKQIEWHRLKAMGLEDIAMETWFCHTPILGLPCGRCNPCKDALNENMAWRVPKIGRILGLLRAVINKIKNI